MDRNTPIPTAGPDLIERIGFIAQDCTEVLGNINQLPIDLGNDKPLERSP
jgi:hypothetical protein